MSSQIMTESASKVLVIGATGYIGKYLVEASVKLGHPTFALVRSPVIAAGHPGTHHADEEGRNNLIQSFHNAGVHVLFGDVNDREVLVGAMRKVDVVYSALGHHPYNLLEQQTLIIAAIKQAGNIKRFFPSEFGFDVERNQFLEPLKSVLAEKIKIREAVRKEGIPFTFVSSNFGATYFLSRLGQVEADGIPAATVSIIGDGNPKAIHVDERDIATYSIKAADDERTLNKILYIRPPANIYSANELVSLWETKTNKTLERIYVSEEEVLKKINESPGPLPFFYAVAYAGFIKGQTTNFDIDPSIGVEASILYPDVEYTTVEKYMDRFL
uniref:Eugenol synthase 2 n=1 Tax=Gymnadenia odoratissima TaxID=97904 RepID=A0A0E3NBN0_GYMOD|nr:eugenol synthase 2 [Gymnadenia odoratissima]